MFHNESWHISVHTIPSTEFENGHREVLSANIIAENLIAQVDEEGHRQRSLSNGEAIRKEDGHFIQIVEWKDGGGNWVALKDLKHAYPVELAQYAVDNKIDTEPAFVWWVPWTLKKQKLIIAKIKSKYWERTHKFGIRIPKNVKETMQIDKENGNTMWMDAVKKEMGNVRVAFEEHNGNPNELVGYQKIECHMIFDIKLSENFRRKARYVAGGHKTKPPEIKEG